MTRADSTIGASEDVGSDRDRADHAELAATRCPACGSHDFGEVLQLPPVPCHVGLLWATPEEAIACPKGEMRVALCDRCGYVWNLAFELAKTAYENDYDNSLHHSPKFAAWEQQLAESLIESHGLREASIVEIGCGDGRFLSKLCLLGDNSGVGFEPGINDERASELVGLADVRIVPEFADPDTIRATEADLVVARHLLEHLPDPTVLLDAISGGARPGARVYIEVPNLAWTIRRGAFEDLMFEHCGYYTPETLAHQLRRHGFSDVRSESTFDGLFAAVRAACGGGRTDCPDIDPVLVAEIREGLVSLAARINSVGDELAARHASGQRVVAWGGGARAVGLLNMVPEAKSIEFVVDVNPRKQGTFVTGSGHPIVAPHDVPGADPDVVLVVNPVYRAEIAGMLQELNVDAEILST